MDFSSFPQDIGRREQVVKYTYDQQIIKPPESNITNGRITQHLVIDSRNRDCDKFPDPNNYVIELKGVLDKVVGLTMTRYAIPKSGYVVHSGNNQIHFKEIEGDSGVILTATLNVGNYTIDEFLLEIGVVMTTASITGTTYGAEVNTKTRKITISFIPGTGFEKLVLITGCLKQKRHPLTHKLPSQSAPSVPDVFNACTTSALDCDTTVNSMTQEVVMMPNSAAKLMGFGKGVYCSNALSDILTLDLIEITGDVENTGVEVTATITGVNIGDNNWTTFNANKLTYTSFWNGPNSESFCRPNTSEGDGDLHKILLTGLNSGTSGSDTEMKFFDYNGSGSGDSEELVHQTSEKFVITPIDGTLGDGREFNQAQGIYTTDGASTHEILIPSSGEGIYVNLYNYMDAGDVAQTARMGFVYCDTNDNVAVYVVAIGSWSGGSGSNIVIVLDEELPNFATDSCVVVGFVDASSGSADLGGSVNDYYKLMVTGEITKIENTLLMEGNSSTSLAVGDKIAVSVYDGGDSDGDSANCQIVCVEKTVLNLHTSGDNVRVILDGEIPDGSEKVVYKYLGSVGDDISRCAGVCASSGNSISGNCPYCLDNETYLLLKLNEEVGSESRFEGASDVALGTFDVALLKDRTWDYGYHDLGDQYVTGARKLYNPPRDKLSKVRVTFYTGDGRLYDFNCKDHMFCLEVDMLNQPNHYKVVDM